MNDIRDQLITSTRLLHSYLLSRHWHTDHLAGPDPVGKIQWRITRFVRSYVPALPNDDVYVYLQGNAYWIRANVLLMALTGDTGYRDFVVQTAKYIVAAQQDGVWLHPPIPGRRGFVSTVEGVWASLGLLQAYRSVPDSSFLDAAKRWYETQTKVIGFQDAPEGIAANYYAHSQYLVPNVTTMLVWLSAELADLTQDDYYLQYTEPMLRFLRYCQLDNGELPYEHLERPHFMCFQYNSFEFLDLANYDSLRPDNNQQSLLQQLAAFLATGVRANGSCRYNCHKQTPEVNYWTAALGTALLRAHSLGLGNYHDAGLRALTHLLEQQRPDGSFDFSYNNYRLLRDRRSYPRYLSMILYLMLESQQLLTLESLPSDQERIGSGV